MSHSLPSGVQRPHDPAYQLEFVRGEGCYLWDSSGKRYLDLVSGYSSLSFGHSHPRLVAAAKDQFDKLVHVVGWNHPWRTELADRLSQLAPVQQRAQTWISTTGARAVEIAWKIAYAARPGVIVSFDYAYHGRSIATSQITSTDRIDIPLPQTIESVTPTNQRSIALPVLPYPPCEACPFALDRSSCAAECFNDSEARLRLHADKISAVIVEPALGARGYYFAANAFFHRLRKVTRETGILLIDDEIQMGLGRLGSLFAATSQGWEPDLIVLGKSLGGGLVNVSAIIGNERLMSGLPPGVESETFAADPLACRVAIEVLDLFHEEIEPRLAVVSSALKNGIDRLHQELSNRFPSLRLRVDSQGCAAVIQILPNSPEPITLARGGAPNPEPMALATGGAPNDIPSHRTQPEASAYGSGASPAAVAQAWTGRALHGGLLVHWSGKHRDRIVLIPPLTANAEKIDQAIEILIATCPGSQSTEVT
ncbi:MAG: aminotransferase class III-fold pyridoxal phosphate-dependent enzyme [Planctomycetota bacterium]|nr:aminotransferase class III-fold pyridoxal phosphate-dependent enzyme [Planctomycetota bacterium]